MISMVTQGESDFSASLITIVTDSGDKLISEPSTKKKFYPRLRILEKEDISHTERQENVFKLEEIRYTCTLLCYLSVQQVNH